MVRGLILGGLAFAATFALEQKFGELTKDIRRYDRLRAMSGEGPMWREQLGNLLGMFSDYGASRRGEALGLLESLQSDVIRYARVSSM